MAQPGRSAPSRRPAPAEAVLVTSLSPLWTLIPDGWQTTEGLSAPPTAVTGGHANRASADAGSPSWTLTTDGQWMIMEIFLSQRTEAPSGYANRAARRRASTTSPLWTRTPPRP